MNLWLPFDTITADTPIRQVGGKAHQLAALLRAGYRVPAGGCIPSSVYCEAVAGDGFRERLQLELHRKPFEQMRWEEIWDAALRIRNWFARMPLPESIVRALRQVLSDGFGDRPVAVRSSAPAEDSASRSFAGLHESFVDVRGPEAILHHVRLVWASLWSDRALLYRQELGLDVENSAMAVVVQEYVEGTCSGVAFSQSPIQPDQGLVEAVPGRGEDLVDGAKEPDRWFVDRASARILRCDAAAERQEPCLAQEHVLEVYGIARHLEEARRHPQDMEWTLREAGLFLLQTRPVTTPPSVDPHGDDRRGWYLTLTRSLPDLRRLHERITSELLPGMEADAARMASEDLSELSDAALRANMRERKRLAKQWRDAYWEYCIPFAHGMRLFGQIYNDRMEPEDPYEFVALLSGDELISLQRNEELRQVGLLALQHKDPAAVRGELDAWIDRYGTGLSAAEAPDALRQRLLATAMRVARTETPERGEQDAAHRLEETFLATFGPEERDYAGNLLTIARASYALRDNDNHYLERIDAERKRARDELRRRSADEPAQDDEDSASSDEVASGAVSVREPDPRVRGKQLVGQPSSAGIATGPARVIKSESDITSVQEGEVIVCDAISPTMTFVVPLVAAIVERRGGMLIHGAIIAREYGIPCVTGVSDATELIGTGQTVSVDGYLGLVAVRPETA